MTRKHTHCTKKTIRIMEKKKTLCQISLVLKQRGHFLRSDISILARKMGEI